MKSKKLLLPLLLLCITLLAMVGCTSNKILAKPQDTTLEFWVTEKVTGEDFKDHYSVVGVFGAYVYFGKDYQPNEITEENSDIQPKHCVTYTVTAYPDYSSNNGKFDTVTRIQITDPQVSIYGITCHTSLEEFDETMKELGCKVSKDSDRIHTATLGKMRFKLFSFNGEGELSISVEVTNKHGIVY